MTIGGYSAVLGLAILLTSISGIYLLINARGLAAFFSTPENELAPGPGGRRPPRGRLVVAILVFAGSLVASLAIWSYAGTDAASNVVESHPAEVQRP